MLRTLDGRWFVLLLAMLVLAGCGTTQAPVSEGQARPATQPASLMLDWVPNSDHGGVYTAIQKGIFRRHGIAATVRVPSANTAQIQLVAAGKVDFGITYETDLLNARAQHIPVQSVMCIMQHPLNTVMALKSSHITRPRDLVGKAVGMAGSPSDKPIVSAMMAADHRSINQVRMVNVGYSLLPALLSHKVDAVVGVYWTWEAIQARQKGYPVNVMRVERWGVPNYCELVLIANQKTVSERPAFIRNVVQSLQQGYAEAEAHPNQAWQALHAADKTLDRPLVLQSLILLRPAITSASTIGFQDPKQWSNYVSWLNANKLLTARVDVSKAFTNRFLEARVR